MQNNCSDKSLPVVALCYDFDKTLSPKNMQEYSLIPRLGIDADTFWSDASGYAFKEGMDKMLSYMKRITEIAESKRVKITVDDFREMGKSVELFEGVDTWFDRINEYGKNIGVNLEHYIISAGLKEIIEGTCIADKFTAIYASSFDYDEYNKPVWPKQIVNYTTKTQYIFRINKDCLDLSDEEGVNRYLKNEDRRVPFSNIIYIGDSETDIPAMRVVKREGGHSIGVYNPLEKNLRQVCGLINQDRINYFAPASYEDGGALETVIKNILRQIKSNFMASRHIKRQQDLSARQQEMASLFDHISAYCASIDARISSGEITDREGAAVSLNAYLEDCIKKLQEDFPIAFAADFIAAVEKLKIN